MVFILNSVYFKVDHTYELMMNKLKPQGLESLVEFYFPGLSYKQKSK